MTPRRVLYLEPDCGDGRYKSPRQIGNDYTIGELFVHSTNPEPDDEYIVRAYRGEQIVNDRLVKYRRNHAGNYDFRLVFEESGISYPYPICFRTYVIPPFRCASNLPSQNLWILFELSPAPAILDQLEEIEDYNLVGDAVWG